MQSDPGNVLLCKHVSGALSLYSSPGAYPHPPDRSLKFVLLRPTSTPLSRPVSYALLAWRGRHACRSGEAYVQGPFATAGGVRPWRRGHL